MNGSHQQAKRILVVEDEEYLRDLYLQILQEAGYLVEVAADGQQAYEKLMGGEYDLVLLDIILPKMDGLQVIQKLAQGERFHPERIVFLSNLGQDLVISKATDYGVRGFMVKSDYTPDQLLREVQKYLEEAPSSSSVS